MTADDPLDNEISVSGELTETGIKGSAKSRGITALDRLAGNLFDWANPYLEGIAERRRAKTKGSVRVVEAMTDAAVKAIEQDQQKFARPAIEAHYKEIFEKQENREAVAQIALENLKQIPDEKLAESDSGGRVIEEDWLNYFSSHAERASSEKLREAFGRILSGEIQKPGSFSFSTLRIVSELNRQSAEFFQDVASKAFSISTGSDTPTCIVKPGDLRGVYLEQFLKLEALGLIQEAGGTFGLNLDKNKPTGAYLRFGSIILLGTHKDQSSAGRLNLIMLTPSGTELCTIIPMAHEAAAREIGKMLAQKGLAVTLHKVTSVSGTAVHITQPGEVVSGD